MVFRGCGLRCHAGGCDFAGLGGLRRGHSGEDGGHFLGPRVGGGWLGGPGRDQAGSGGRGRRGVAVFAFWDRLRWAHAMREGVWVGVRGGGTVRVGCIRGAGGLGLGFQGCVRGVCAGNWAGWVRREALGSPRRVCVGSRIWEAVRGVRWEGLWRACVVVWPGERSPCHRARGCARWWACVSHRVGSGEEGAGAGVVWRGVGLGSCSLCWCMCPLAAARLRGHL